MVELAMAMPFLLILIVGIIDFGFLFNDVISVRQGARDGIRQASVGKLGPPASCDLDSAGSAVNVTGTTASLMCLAKSLDDVPDTKTRVRIMVGEAGCGTTCYEVGKPITICEQYETRSLTGVLPVLSGRVHTTRTVLRVETKSPLGLQTGWENPLKGSWSCAAPASVSP